MVVRSDSQNSLEIKNAIAVNPRQRLEFMERETGFEPATLSLRKENEPEEDPELTS